LLPIQIWKSAVTKIEAPAIVAPSSVAERSVTVASVTPAHTTTMEALTLPDCTVLKSAYWSSSTAGVMAILQIWKKPTLLNLRLRFCEAM